MLDNTINISKNIVDSVKKTARTVDIISQIIYILYLGIALVLRSGFFIANAVLFLFSLVYFIYFIASMKEWYTISEKKKRATIKKICKIAKKIVNLSVIILSMVELYFAPELNIISLAIVAIMLLGFVASIILEKLVSFVEKRFELFIEALKMDFAILIKVKNIFVRELPSEKAVRLEKEKEVHAIVEKQCEKGKRKKLWDKKVREDEKAEIKRQKDAIKAEIKEKKRLLKSETVNLS